MKWCISGLAMVLGLCGGQARAGVLTVDTTGSWTGGDAAINSGSYGSGQSLTVQSGYTTFDDIGFFFDSAADGQTFTFSLLDGAVNGPTLFSNSFVVQSGINVVTIGKQLTAGEKVYALLDYNGYTGRSAHFITTANPYSGGNSLFKATSSGGYSGYSAWDHEFVAHFSDTAPSAVPEPASMTLLGLGAAGMAGYRLRRRKAGAAM